LYLALRRQNEELEQHVRERTRELEDTQREMLDRLARITEYRDDSTGDHTRRVGDLSAAIAQRLGVPAEEVEMLRLAAPLHDLGKAGVPDSVLLKPARLSPA